MDNFEDRRLGWLGRLSTGDDACADSPKVWGNLPKCMHSCRGELWETEKLFFKVEGRSDAIKLPGV